MDKAIDDHQDNEIVAGENLDSPANSDYAFTVDESVQYFLKHGFRFAPRTLSWHCQTELLDCKKFTSGSALKWKVTKKSLDERIETLNREGFATAGSGKQLPAGMLASNSEQLPAIAGNYENELLELLKSELKDKNKQIDQFQSIIREHNKQFENLNKTIQLSNQTIQQLNRTLALPQVKDVIGVMHADRNDDRTADAGHVHASEVYDSASGEVVHEHPEEPESGVHRDNDANQPEDQSFQELT